MQITIASGKGGTGKTTVSVNLFHYIGQHFEANVQLIDCDVEEPNTVLFFQDLTKTRTKKVFQYVPEINTKICTFCRKCSDWCSFNAITLVASHNFALINKDLCHSCGACIVACTQKAITEHPHLAGKITSYKTESGQFIVEGRLQVGSSMQTMLIKKLKQDVSNNNSCILFDAPPGTSCPVIQTLTGTNYVVLVTEPTPFGLHDLKTAVEVVKQLKIPFGVIVNKSGLGSQDVYQFLKTEKINLLGKIPFSKAYAREYSEGKILSVTNQKTEKIYLDIIRKIFESQ